MWTGCQPKRTPQTSYSYIPKRDSTHWHCILIQLSLCFYDLYISFMAASMTCTSHPWLLLWPVHPIHGCLFDLFISFMAASITCSSHSWLLLWPVHLIHGCFYDLYISFMAASMTCSSHSWLSMIQVLFLFLMTLCISYWYTHITSNDWPICDWYTHITFNDWPIC